MKLKVYTTDGASSAEKDFDLPVFEGDKGVKALRQVVLALQANRRQGTVSTKTRTTVHGTGKKPFRQKGTGRARQGSWRGPQHYHGSVAHGPQPRDWSQKINDKVRALAFRRALFERVQDGEIGVIERWDIEGSKTKNAHALLGKIASGAKSVLVVDDTFADSTALAMRNLPYTTLTEATTLNTWDLVRYDRIVLSEKGLEKLLARLNPAPASAA